MPDALKPCDRCHGSGSEPATADGQVPVVRGDLEYVLAHVADEIHGNPDPAHWDLPLFREALGRLRTAAGSAP